MKVHEIISTASKHNIDLDEDTVQDNFFSVICWFNVYENDNINWSIKEGSKSDLEKMLNQKADDILLLYPGFECDFITFSDRLRNLNYNEEAYYFEFTKKEKK